MSKCQAMLLKKLLTASVNKQCLTRGVKQGGGNKKRAPRPRNGRALLLVRRSLGEGGVCLIMARFVEMRCGRKLCCLRWFGNFPNINVAAMVAGDLFAGTIDFFDNSQRSAARSAIAIFPSSHGSSPFERNSYRLNGVELMKLSNNT